MDFTKNTNLSIEKISENKTSGTELSVTKIYDSTAEKSFLHKDALCDCSQPVVLRKRYEKRNKAVQFTIHFLFPLASYHKNRKKE